jgi:hypothetical protein
VRRERNTGRSLRIYVFFRFDHTHGVSSYFSKLDCAARVRLPRAPPRARTAVLKKWACHLRLCVLCGCACVRGFKGKRLHIDHCAYFMCARGPTDHVSSLLHISCNALGARTPTHTPRTNLVLFSLAGVGGAATRAPQTDTRRRAQLVRGLSLAACYRISLSLSLSLSLRVPCPASPFLVTLARSLAQSALSLTL